MDGWKMNFLLGWPSFRGYVSFTEGSAATKTWEGIAEFHFWNLLAIVDICFPQNKRVDNLWDFQQKWYKVIFSSNQNVDWRKGFKKLPRSSQLYQGVE